jgi:acetyltransferase-like isoleucine patch superfamily enzyme
MKFYLLLDKIYKRVKSFLLVADIKLKGGNLPWRTRIEGRIVAGNLSNLKIGTNVAIGKNVMFNMGNGDIEIGDNCTVASGTRWDVLGGKIEIGKRVLINSYTIITSWHAVTVGNDTLIAPFCHITDRVHGISKDVNVKDQIGQAQPIEIGSDVWVASSCVILKGVTISNGAVVGANSLVNRNVDSYSIVVGSPARVIGVRE